MKKLKPDQLCRIYDPENLSMPGGGEPAPAKAIIGQARAVSALKFGLGNKGQGFNIYVAGVPGTGKQTAVRHFLKDLARQELSPGDWCYVNNFKDPYQPRRLSLPRGQARVFRGALHETLLGARAALVKVLESEEYSGQREKHIQKFRDDGAAVFDELNRRAREENFLIQRTPLEFVAVPMVGGRPMTDKEFVALSDDDKEGIIAKQEELKEDLRRAARRMRDLEKQTDQRLADLEQRVATLTLDSLLEELREQYGAIEGIPDFLDELKADILEHLGDFLQSNQEGKQENPLSTLKRSDHIPRRYEVNVFVDNGQTEGAPIVLELNPTYSNLFGRIEKESMMGTWVTDFSLIRGGALHAANGGYLILPVVEVLRNLFSWDSLKRALRNGEIVIEEPGEQLGFLTTKSLKPEPVPLHLQVILIGSPMLYFLLYEYDEDFRELFKVKADFDTEMENTEDNLRDFTTFIQGVCREERLLPMDAAGMARVLTFSHRRAEDQNKLSIRFGEIIDLVKEAHHYAAGDGAASIGAGHVRRAMDERLYRSSLWQEKMQEMIEKELILIDVNGEETGQVNGISVIQMGDVAFGRPNRITASVSTGRAGILDIEREAKLGGPIHTKGVLILSGYLAEKFGQDKALSLSAQLVFEQSYSEVEGDSASSAELYALLSGLSGLPVKQGIGVTGSVNQKGEIQAVGGINEKIEGFFDVCRLNGLTGGQGVLIPHSNLKNLMLKEEVVEAVRAGKFNIWAIGSIEEGIERLTGTPAGKALPDDATGAGRFPEGSVFDRVNRRLVEMADILRRTEMPAQVRLRRGARRPRK